MKKITHLCIFVFMFALVFSFSSSAFDSPFYSIDINEEFYADTENTDTSSVWSNVNGSSISLSITPNSGIDFSSVSDSEIEILTNQIKSTYETLELDSVENVKGFKGEICSRNSFNYTLDFSVNNVAYSVEGFIFPVEQYLYTVETSSASQSDRAVINDMLSSLKLSDEINYDENDVVLDAGTDRIKFESEDGAVSFELPAGFIEQACVDPIEKQWNKNDSSVSVAVFTIENTGRESMIDLSDEDLKEIASDFAEGADSDAGDTVAENVTVNGYKGIKINTTIKTIGLTADTDIYSFSTEDSIIFIYFYRYAETDEKVIDEILSSLTINDELLVSSGGSYIFIGTLAGALIGALIAVVLIKKKKKPSVNANDDTAFSEYPKL